MNDVINLLEEGDLRSVGRVSEVLNLVADQPNLFDELVHAIAHSDPGIRMHMAFPP